MKFNANQLITWLPASVFQGRNFPIVLIALMAIASSPRVYATTQMQFDAPVHFNLGAPCDQICAGDFNGDGRPDLAVAFNGIYISILTNDGSGSLVAFTNYDSFLDTRAFASGDFNNDHKLDFATVGESSIVAWLGNGDGTFAPTNISSIPYLFGSAITTGDLNGDGNLDLAVLTQLGLQIFLGQGNGAFVFLTNYYAGNYSIAAADFNGDTNLDLVTANYSSSSMSVLVGHGDGLFAPPVNYSGDSSEYHLSVVAGDFNGDAKPDLATVNYYNGSVSVRLNNGDGTFGPEKKFAVAFGPAGLLVADFDGDGNLDLLSRNSDPVLAILPGNGDGTFAAAVTNFTGLTGSAGFGSQTVAVADFNGDGKPDIASTRIAENSVTLFLNQAAQPTLHIKATNGVARLTWPDWHGYFLESTLDLAAVDGWATVTNPSTVMNGEKTLDCPMNGERRFFRLRKE